MHILVPILIVLAVIAGAIYFIPPLKKFVFVRLGLQVDLDYAISGLTKVVKSLEQHAADELAKAEALAKAQEAAAANAVKASKIASNVSTLLS